MRTVLLVVMLSIPLVQLSAQQQVPSAVPQDSPCASQPRSLSELAASFDKGRAPSAKELAGVWVEIGSFDYGMQVADDEEIPPHFRSLKEKRSSLQRLAQTTPM
jgi:hypothetical protein